MTDIPVEHPDDEVVALTPTHPAVIAIPISSDADPPESQPRVFRVKWCRKIRYGSCER
jgi:hypothetical protein